MSRLAFGPHVGVGAALLLCATASGWTHFCPDSLSAGDVSLHLLGEQLRIDDDVPGTGMVVGHYQSSTGAIVVVECSGRPEHHMMSGEFA